MSMFVHITQPQDVYRTAQYTHAEAQVNGVHGTPEQVREKLVVLIGMVANHLLLNPVADYPEQLEALAEVVELR